MIWSRLLVGILAVVLALPVPLTASAPHPEPVPHSVPIQAAAATATGATGGDAPILQVRKTQKQKQKDKNKHKKNRQKRAHAREVNRQKKAEKDERARIRADAAAAAPKFLMDEPGPGLCGPGMIYLAESGHCTHGPDPAPPGTTISEPVQLVPAAAARRAAAEVACDGDGVSGYRVQVLYVRSSSAADQYDAYRPSIRAWAAGADAILRESSSAIGDELGFRFVMTSGCEIDVRHVTVAPTDITSFGRTIDSLEAQGYNRSDRIYLLFADTTSAGICGVGTLWLDDRDTPANFNNSGSSFSRVDRSFGCWNATTAAHELMHNLGGVQYSAPHTSGGGHCIDEWDVMCYSDTPDFPAMTVVCTPQQTFANRFDCGYDDYFHPSPAPGSYLDTHWNTADSRFLIGKTATGDTTPPVVTWLSPVSNGGTYRAASGTIPLTVSAADPSGVTRVEFWRYSEVRDGWVFIAEDVTAPYTASIAVSALDPGMNYLTADGYDTSGNWIEEPIWVERTAAPPPPPPPPPPPDTGNPAATAIHISSPGSGARVKARKWVTLGATVADAPAGGLTIEYRVCPGSACAWEEGQSLATVSDPPYSARWKAPKKGAFTFLAQATHGDGTSVSAPVTVSVKKEKGKRKR